ncbi:MAG: hypothetical protein ACRENL_00005, partial [Candidatus Dormibacteria bacterium]
MPAAIKCTFWRLPLDSARIFLSASKSNRSVLPPYAYAGSYWTFLRQVRPLRPALIREPEVRFETLPGVQTQADWK